MAPNRANLTIRLNERCRDLIGDAAARQGVTRAQLVRRALWDVAEAELLARIRDVGRERVRESVERRVRPSRVDAATRFVLERVGPLDAEDAEDDVCAAVHEWLGLYPEAART